MGQVWTTKDGRKIPVNEMGDTHLINAWKFLDRKETKVREAEMFYNHPIWGPRGEMAQEAAEQAMGQAYDVQAVCSYWMKIFEKEMKKRDIVVPPRSVPQGPPEVEVIEDLGFATIARIKRKEPARRAFDFKD